MTKDKSRIQSCIDHINTAVDVDPWAKELVAEMGAEILKQLNNSNDQLDNSNDCISKQAAIDIFDDYNVSVENGELEAYSRDRKRLCDLPSVQPYTDEQIQRMQVMEQAQLEKAFELGKLDAQEEIIRCKECRWRKDQSGSTAWLPCRALATPDDFYCERAERGTDETD